MFKIFIALMILMCMHVSPYHNITLLEIKKVEIQAEEFLI